MDCPLTYSPTHSVRSIAAELESLDHQLFADLVQTRDAEVFALEEVVAGAAHQFADGRKTKPDNAIASQHLQMQIGNVPVEHRPLVRVEVFGCLDRLLFANLVGELA